jgi:hypothetical protein
MADPKKLAAVKGTHLTITSTGKALSDDSKLRLRSQLKNALNAELASHGETLGLKQGDKVAISSSVGQSISF